MGVHPLGSPPGEHPSLLMVEADFVFKSMPRFFSWAQNNKLWLFSEKTQHILTFLWKLSEKLPSPWGLVYNCFQADKSWWQRHLYIKKEKISSSTGKLAIPSYHHLLIDKTFIVYCQEDSGSKAFPWAREDWPFAVGTIRQQTRLSCQNFCNNPKSLLIRGIKSTQLSTTS